MSEYKLLVADIDGTVVDHGSTGTEIDVDHPAKRAIMLAQEAGKLVTLATGRNYPKAAGVIKSLGIESPVIVNGGSQIVEARDGSVLWEKRLKPEIAQQICNFLLTAQLDSDLKIGFGFLNEETFTAKFDRLPPELIYLDIIGITDPAKVDSVIGYVKNLRNTNALTTPSPQFPGRTNIIVTDEQASKYHALVQLQTIMGIEKSQTIAIGDASNDLPLFEAAGLKVAVDNASPELKSVADIIVSSVHEHGFVEVVHQHLLAN